MSDSNGQVPGKVGRVTLKKEIASVVSDPTRWLFGKRLVPTDEVLSRRGGASGLAVYEELERDAQVFSVLQKRRLALVGREWTVKPGDESAAAKAVADMVREALEALPFNRVVEDALAALLVGVSVLEVMWQQVGDKLLPSALLSRNPRRFSFDIGDDGTPVLKLLTRTNLLDGEPVPERKFVVHRFGGRYGDPWGLGLGNRLFWPVYFKRQGVGFWMSALEKFGQPTAIGKYPAGTSDDQMDALLAALGSIASDAGVAFPDGMVVELLEAKRAGSFDSYQTLASYMDDDIAKVVLGETLTTNAGQNGSRALGTVHNQVRLEITKGDADNLSDTLNATLVTWIVELNAPGYAGPMPRLWWEVDEAEDLNARAERDVKISSMGFAPTLDYITQTYGEGWEAKAAPPPLPTGLARLQSGLAPAAAFAQATDPRDAVDLLAEQLGQVASPAMEATIARIRGLLDKAATLEEFRVGLAALYPDLPTDQFAAVMGDALVLANLAGRSDLTDGIM
jgi:phage gp29-like protein